MKAFRRLTISVLTFFLLVWLGTNLALLYSGTQADRSYRVEISRAAREIEESGLAGLDLSRYPSLVRVTTGTGAEFLAGDQEEYAIREIGGKLYRFDYQAGNRSFRKPLLVLNLGLGAVAAILLGTMIFFAKEIIRPFEAMKDLPCTLAKGNLAVPLQQQKNRYFGKFLWGMDLLREKLEDQKTQELKLQKEKKSLILSLAHDIKTPLSAIKLYSQALSRNLYEDRKKQTEIAENIGNKVDEIESYLSQIMTASQEDFLHLEVSLEEFYLDSAMQEIQSYYGDKLGLLKIPFSMDWGGNCLMKGDRDRTVEVFQNLMENAIKYGQGGAISLSWEEEGNCRILTLTNENCSLSKDQLPHIFDSFWRGSNGEKVPGSGLGLTICRQLVNAMGGEVFAEIRDGTMNVSVVLKKA